jgi:hypothetical protein
MTQLEQALSDFKNQIRKASGREAKASEVKIFHDQVQTAIAHRGGRIVQHGLCDFETLDGRATTIEVSF